MEELLIIMKKICCFCWNISFFYYFCKQIQYMSNINK